MPITLIPINPSDRDLMAIMIRSTSPRWMRLAACIALEGKRVVLPRNGHPILDRCDVCAAVVSWTVHAFHKDPGGETRCLQSCDACGTLIEDRSYDSLLEREANPLRGIREAF
jgi:hypothetical protein